MKHTSGPWHDGFCRFDGRELHLIVGNNGTPVISYAHSEFRGLPDNKTDDERLANQRLILAAPDLLDACIAALEISDRTLHNQYDGTRTPENQAVYDKVKAAINKALGK